MHFPDKFIQAQENTFKTAMQEITAGRKRSHWMWYIFPQIAGLGQSETSRYYAINNRQEAEQYLRHPVLGKRLINASSALLLHDGRTANSIFGTPDDMKLKSSMTLFASLTGTDPVFQKVLDKFFRGEKDERTIQLLQ